VYDESLIAEQLARNLAFLGPQGNRDVRNAFVIVIGLGGVGSSAATSLVRSGVGRIRLIDFDQVTLSSLNVCFSSNIRIRRTPKVILHPVAVSKSYKLRN
jgi:tRNA A37 threonylcarbamoyladenosine dehydratase